MTTENEQEFIPTEEEYGVKEQNEGKFKKQRTSTDQDVNKLKSSTEQPKSAEEITLQFCKDQVMYNHDYVPSQWDIVYTKEFADEAAELYATLRESSARNLRQEVLKFVHHWEIYFQSPKVGQPPAIQDLKDAVERSINSPESSAQQRIKELQAFKDYTHKRLDDAGIPIDPESPHKEAGCRIGGRLDFVFERIKELEERNEESYKLGVTAGLVDGAIIGHNKAVDDVTNVVCKYLANVGLSHPSNVKLMLEELENLKKR